MGSVSLGFSIATSLSLGTLFFFIGWLSLKYNWNLNILQWTLFPVLAYIISFCLNGFAQLTSCSKIDAPTLAKLSLFIPRFILIAFVLCLSSFIRSPIEVVISPSSRAVYGPIFAVSFYVFWATMFGEALSIGIATACF